MRPQTGELFGGDLEHEIRRETRDVTLDLFVEALGSHVVERSKVTVEQHPMAAQDQNRLRDVVDRHDGSVLAPGHP